MTLCVLDTDVVIAVLDRSDAQHQRAITAVSSLSDSGATLMLSLVNYAETLVRPAQDEQMLRRAIDSISYMEIVLVPPTPDIAREAARVRGMNVSLADGFAVATAGAHDASLATFDLRVRRALAQTDVKLSDAAR